MSVTVVRGDERLRATIVRARPLVDPRTGAHVGAASGLVIQRGRLFCIQDDALSGVWVDPVTLSLEEVVLIGEGKRLPKRKKPDFEAVFESPDGTIRALGSGGTDRRRRLVRYEPETGRTTAVDLGALYDALAARLPGPPNIEGAVLLGDTVRLFHRANGKSGGQNASYDVTLATLDGGGGGLENEVLYDLGAIPGAPYRESAGEAGIPFSFTDATLLGDGRLMYLSAAEDSEDAVADGPVLGGAIGVIEDGGGRYALITEADGTPSHRKIEGLAMLPGDLRAFAVTDPDDPEKPSELCELRLEGPW